MAVTDYAVIGCLRTVCILLFIAIFVQTFNKNKYSLYAVFLCYLMAFDCQELKGLLTYLLKRSKFSCTRLLNYTIGASLRD